MAYHSATIGGVYGYVAEFTNPDDLLAAAEKAREAGYRKMDAYSPFPIHGLSEAIGFKDTKVPWIVFIGGVVGMLAGYGLQYWTSVIDYPLNVGGRPLNSVIAFFPVTYETTILFAAFGGAIGMIALNGLPKPYHSIFNAPGFERASQDRFFLAIEAKDPQFELVETKAFLLSLNPENVAEVEA